MNTTWIARVVLATILMYVSAMAMERVLAWFNRPRRWVWLAAMLATIAIPIAASLAPDLMPAFGLDRSQSVARAVSTSEALPAMQIGSAPVIESGAVAAAPASSITLSASLWIAASASLFLLAVAVGGRLAVLRARARPTVIDGVPVRLTKNLGPLVTGYLKPAILVPDWVVTATESERHLILMHERQHIVGGDHWSVPFAALLLIAMPWNPGLWMVYARLRLAIETDCDARVVAAGADRREYGAALIRVAGSAGPHSVLSPAWSNRARQLEQRVRAMTETSPRARVLRASLLSIGAAILVAVACDAATPDAAASDLQPRPASQSSPAKRDTVAEVTAQSMPRQASGRITVTGYTRASMRARVTFDGTAGRLVVMSGRVIRRVGDVEVDIVTPAEFRVEGVETYRIVATSLESDGEVEIAGTYPDGEGFPTQRSARGPAPGIRFPGAQRVEKAVEARRLAMQVQKVESAMAEMTKKTAPSLPATAGGAKPGQILVESKSGNVAQVRVLYTGGITAIGGLAIAGAGEMIVSTPFVVDFGHDDFCVAVVSVNPADSLNVNAFSPEKAWSMHSRSTTASVVRGRAGGGGLGRYVPDTPLSQSCNF